MKGCNPPSKFTLDLGYYAVKSVKKYTGCNTILYSDAESARYFKKFDFNDIIITEFPYINDLWWNIGKMYVYTLQRDPFVHMDLDIVAEKNFMLPDTDIICEFQRNIEYDTESLMLAYEDKPIPYKILCSGIIGGNNYGDIFIKNYNNRIEMMKKIDSPIFENLFSVEEVAFTQLVKEKNLSIGSPVDRSYTHYQGYNKEIRFSDIPEKLSKLF